MPKKEIIRYNSALNLWEHWVPNPSYFNGGYWSIGYTGNNSIHSPKMTFDVNDSNIIQSMEDVEYNDLIINLYKSVPLSNNYELINNTTFSELINQNDLIPIINGDNILSLFNTNDIQILIDTNVEFIIQAINPLTDDSQGLIYKWTIGQDNLTTLSEYINILINNANSGNLSYIVANDFGESKSANINIIVNDPITLPEFNSNLIKDGLINWNIESGTPLEMNFWKNDANSYAIPALFTSNGINPLLLNANTYLVGGDYDITNPKNTILTQEIDLTPFSEYINKTIYGVNSTSILLYGYIGTWGDNLGYIGKTIPIYNSINYGLYSNKWTCGVTNNFAYHLDTTQGLTHINKDSIKVTFDFLTNNNINLKTFYFNSNEHSGEMEFFLKYGYLDIPLNTSKLKITITFNKSYDTAQYYNYRWWEELGQTPNIGVTAYNALLPNIQSAFHHDHLTAIYNLNARIDINSRYLNDIKSILNI